MNIYSTTDLRFPDSDGKPVSANTEPPNRKPVLSLIELYKRVAELERSLEPERRRVQQLEEYLRSIGIAPDQIPPTS